MRCFVEESSVREETITYWEFSFGSSRQNRDVNTYRLELDKTAFRQILDPDYRECVEELMDDDKITGEFVPPFPNANGYPTLEEFMKIKGPYFYEFFNTHLKFNFLSKFFIENSKSLTCRYGINSITDLRVSEQLVIVSGECVNCFMHNT